MCAADEAEPDAGSTSAFTTMNGGGDGVWFDSLESAILHDRPDMLPQSVASRMYFTRQNSAAAQALAARLTWDEKIEFSYSPEWNKDDETPVYCRIIERAGAWRSRQGENTPVANKPPSINDPKSSASSAAAAAAGGAAGATVTPASTAVAKYKAPTAMPIALDILGM